MRKSFNIGCTVLIAIPVLILVGFYMYLYGSQTWHNFVQLAWAGAYWLVPLVLAIVSGIFAYAQSRLSLGFLSALFGGVMIVTLIIAPYQRALNYLETVEVQEVESNELSFRERAPYDVAVAMSKRNMGDTVGTATGYIKAIPALGDHGMYSTSLERREYFTGYESTQFMQVPLYGQARSSEVEMCDWSEDASLRFGGMAPGNNLARAIYQQTPAHVSVAERDHVVVCEDDRPILYAPLIKLSGFPFAIEVPAGVAIYDGKTGELTIEENYEGEIPVYPSGISAKQRVSTHASEGWIDYMFRHRAGWEDTASDESDPNGNNRAEFNLASEDASETYKVTPLTRRGDAQSIIGLGTLQANKVESGKLNTYHVNRYPEGEHRQANSTVADTITADILGGYRASGLTVFEVVPSLDGTWRATVGKAQSINYRAIIDVDGNVELYDSNGNRVGGDRDSTSEDGEAPDLDLGQPLDQMSPDELRDAMDMILDELSERANQASAE